MRRRSLYIGNSSQKKPNINKFKKEKTVIKKNNDIEKELNIRSYSEYRIKDDDSIFDYEDEDIETKMIRLVILKKKGGNIYENINIKRNKKNEFYTKNKKALSILENIFIKRKIKKFLKKLRDKNISVIIKKNTIKFLQKLKSYIKRKYIKLYYYKLIQYLTNYKEILNKSKSYSIIFSPHSSKKKIKKFKIHNNKNIKVELMTKKNNFPKKSGVENILEKIEKEKLKQTLNITNFTVINEKIKKLNNLKKKEEEFIIKINEEKKQLKKEINLCKIKKNLNGEEISQITENKSINEKDSSFFSGKSPSGIGSPKDIIKYKKGSVSEVLTSNENGSSNNIINEVIKLKESNKENKEEIDNKENIENKENKDDELYSINSKESKKSSNSKKEFNPIWMRNSVKNLLSKKLEKAQSKKNMRVSVKLSGLNYKRKQNESTSIFPFRNNQETKENNKENISEERYSSKEGNEDEKLENGENDFNKENDEEDDEEEEEEGEEEEEDESYTKDCFIKLPNNENEEDINYNEKTNLVEYDKFYKEQFLKNDVFKYDVENIKDKEIETINREMNKLDIKRKLIEKKKLKDVMELKGIDTKHLQEEINDLNEKYKETKKEEKKKIELNIDITEEFFNKGRLLNIYFKDKKEKNVPRFSLESSEEIGAKEIIDFKPLRKEEVIRRYFDDCICLEQRKKINKCLVYSRYICKFFVDNWIFDNLSLLIITINSLLIFISDPTVQNNIGNRTDNYFLIFYGLEAILKIVTFTFYSAEDAYIKDYWNILDLLVVIIGLISFILEKSMGGTKISGLSGLKAFRILRPLKTVKKFKGLKKLVIALLASVGHLGETAIILFFFFLFFAVAGLQMWQGLFYRRCMNINYGYFISVKNENYMCSFDSNCETLNSYGKIFICAKGYLNPNSGAINFDNIFTALITAFVMVTLEGWSYIFTYVSKTFKDKIYVNPIIIFIYFHAFIYIGTFYLINLFLAVTNSEFEHIEKNREKLTEKKSFFKLIQTKYDAKEKIKQEKKENEKQLKIKNNKKSDETLKDLYDKVTDEAFHISKNKRDIPKIYSTVKDIYIMAYNCPEELYSEKIRIKNEEKSLCLDVERQQKEIDLLLNEKKKEMDKSKINLKKLRKNKSSKSLFKKEGTKISNSKITEKYKSSGINLFNNINGSACLDDIKNNSQDLLNNKNNIIKNNHYNKSNNDNINNNENEINEDLSEIINLKNKINITAVEISIDNTIKFIKDKNINLAKKYSKIKEEKKNIKINEDKKKENENINQITFFEDANFEKELFEFRRLKKEKILNERKNNRKLTRISRISKMKGINDQSFSFLNRTLKGRSNKKIDYILYNQEAMEENKEKDQHLINKDISFIDDLSLSSLESSESNSQISKKNNKKIHTNVRPKNNIFLTKLIGDDFKTKIENLSLDDDLFNNNLFGYDRYKRKSVSIKNTELESFNNLIESVGSRKDILYKKDIKLNGDIFIKSKIKKPSSSFNFIIKNEDEQKFNNENIRFNLKKYLKKEAEKDNEFLNKDKRKSFLGFLEYAQFQKELKELEEIIHNDSNNEIIVNNSQENSLGFLSEDSYLSRNDKLSIEDIELLPKKLYEKEIYQNEYLIHENIKKNLDSNKLTQKIRAEVFDRESINTNINLTTNELKKFYEEANKKLDELLYVNKKKIRIRKNINLNISGIIKEKNYNKNFKVFDNSEKELNNFQIEEIIDNNNINKNEIKNHPNEFINNLNSSNISIKSPKKMIRKINEENNNSDKKMKRISNSGMIVEKSNLNKNENNSDFPFLNKQKTMKLLNSRNSKNIKSQEIDKNIIKFNEQNKSLFHKNKTINILNKEKQNNKINIKNSIKNINSFNFKAKSINKNINKYPTENSDKFLVKEENKQYTDPLTVKQELIPSYLRGKKYYMNYLNNIHDIDLKVLDNFKIGHWEKEVLGKTGRIIKRRPLPERTEAYFVFNDKKLGLKKYKYMYYNDHQYKENELSYLTIKLKYLPLNVLALIPKRLRDFGKYALKKEINQGALTYKPNSEFLSTVITNNQQLNYFNSRSGRTTSNKIRSKGTLMMSSAFSDNFLIQDEIRFKKNVFEKIYRKVDKFNYLTLSHYFLEEDKLYLKLIDSKKRDEYINNIREINRKKYNRLNVKNEVENIFLFDLKTNSKRYIKWSGDEVLYHSDEDKYRKKWNKIINSLEEFNIIIWHQNLYIKNLQKLRYAFYVFANNEYFDFSILSIVIINSIFMAFDGNFIKPEILNKLNICNYVFNCIFIFEYLVKFIGLSPLVYYSDAFSYLDTLIICFAILDMVTPSSNDTDDVVGTKKSVSSQLSFLRVFRIFRVVRLAKVLRRLKSMRFIISSITKALTSVYYIIIILVLFILIFELLGMSLLSGNFHYQSFLEGFYTTYQILTIENWDSVFIQMWPLNHLCIFYFVIWIFLGNYIIFNLFISILIQSFGENGKEDDLGEDEEIEKIYSLPDYLFTIKKKIKDKNLGKIHEQRKIVDKTILNGKLNNSNTFSTSKDAITKYSSSYINYNNNSILSIKLDDTEKEENLYLFSESSEETIKEDFINQINTETNKRLREWQKINKLFKKNECENALFFIPQNNGFRIFCMKMINKKYFDLFILLIIFLSTIRLIIDTFINGYSFVLLFDICDAIFNVIFLIEAILKICALGFAFDEGSYLTDNWNKIDAIIVCCSFVEFHNISQKYFLQNKDASSVEFLKSLRLLRTLRPLRFISHNSRLRLIITSLFDSILPILNVLFILVVVLFMFSIVGISLFYSCYHDCYTFSNDGTFNLATNSFNNLLAIYEIKNDITSISKFCADKFNGIMDTGPTFKFSNFKTSIITTYILSTMEGCFDIMNSYRIYSDYYGIFFVVFNLVVSYFFLNLFTGIMFKYFNEAYKREQKISKDDKKAPKYYDFLTQIIGARNNYIIWNKPMKGTIQYYLREIVDSEIFENIIMIIIFFNMIIMCLIYEGCSEKLSNFIKSFNYLFTFIFIVECALKLFAYGIRPFFYTAWNKFDFFIVVISIIDWIVAGIDGIDASFLKTFQIIRVLKVLRVSRVIRLVKAVKGLEKLIQTFQWSFSALLNILTLMILVYCIFALLGCYLYDGDKYENYKDKFVYINEYYNMDNFYYSYLLIFRCATGENWHIIMMEMAYKDNGRGQGYSFAFFIITNFITAIVLINLLLMVTLQQYDEFSDKKYNPIDKFNSFLIDFNNAWNKFSTEEDEGLRIKKYLVTQFFMELNWRKLNFPEKGKLESIKKYVSDLKLYVDNEDCVFYHDMIFKIIYKQMGSQIDRTNPENYLIFKTEKKIQKEIKNNINKYINKRGQLNQKQKYNLITFNPLTTHLFYKLSFIYFKTYLNFYKENLELLQHIDETNSPRLDENEFFNSSEEKSENNSQNSDSNSDNNSNPSINSSNFHSEDGNNSDKNNSKNKEENSMNNYSNKIDETNNEKKYNKNALKEEHKNENVNNTNNLVNGS